MVTIKLVVIGASGVGKTSLRSKYISGRFSSGYRATIGADFISKTLPHPTNSEDTVTLQIWDTAGQERFSSLSSAFFRGADAVMLMFDVNTPETLESLTKWWQEFKDRAPLKEENVGDYCCVVVGNKCDLLSGSSSQSKIVNGHANGIPDGSSGTRSKPKQDPVTLAEARKFLRKLIPLDIEIAPSKHPFKSHFHDSPEDPPPSDDEDDDEDNPLTASQATIQQNHIEIEDPTSPTTPSATASNSTTALSNSRPVPKPSEVDPPKPSPVSVSFTAEPTLSTLLPNGSSTTQNSQRRSRSRSKYYSGGTMTTTISMYHTPSSSVYDDADFHSARSSLSSRSDYSPTESEMNRGQSALEDEEDEENSKGRTSPIPRSASSGSAITMTPSLFAREHEHWKDNGNGNGNGNGNSSSSGVNTAETTPENSESASDSHQRDRDRDREPSPPERGPKLFFTSALTSEPTSVNEIFEYIAKRVVLRTEWVEKMEARRMHMRDASGVGDNGSILLGGGGDGGDKGKKGKAFGDCCS